MKQKLSILLIFGLISLNAISQQTKKDTFRLFFMGGQSNMEGHGLNSELPKPLASENKNIWIYHGKPTPDNDITGGLGKWEILKPGNGAGFKSDGKENIMANKFGPELAFGKRLQELYPNDKIAIIKYARGGSSIDSTAARNYGSWEIDYNGESKDGIHTNQFDHFLTTVNGAFKQKDINGDGVEDELIPQGIVWMQGESDAFSIEVANRYYNNLKRLMDLFRATFRTDDLAVVIGKISDSGLDNNGKTWPYGELVQHAQETYAKNDKKAVIVRDTKNYSYSDPYHYDSKGYIDLGNKFAEAIFELNK